VAGAAVAGLVAVTAACGGGDDSGGGEDGVTEISWWAYGPDVAVVDQYLAAFNKDHPDIKVTFKLISQDTYDAVLRPALASDSGPDVFTEDPGARVERFWQYGIDLTPAFEEALGSDWKSKIAQIGIDGFTKDGMLIAAPVGGDHAGTLWINQDLFDQAGLEPPTTYDEWVKVCQEFKAQSIECFIQGAQQTPFDQDTYQALANTIEPGLYSKAVAGEAKWTEPKLVEAFERWGEMFTNGIMQEGALGIAQFPDGNNQFLSGKYAMVMMGTWYMQNTRTDIISAGMAAAGNTGEPFVALPIPFPAAEAGGEQGGLFGNSGGGLAVSAKSKHQEAATTFATWLATDPDGQQIIADLMVNTPSLAGIHPDFDALGLVAPELQEPAIEWMIDEGVTVTETRQLVDADLAEALGTALTTIAEGTVSPADAAQRLQEAAEGLRG
jgi:raffinose/stachyose/melibiose transport system substrate-binding protein